MPRWLIMLCATFAISGCGEPQAPVGQWEAFSQSQSWLIAVRVEMKPNNAMRASALSAFVGDADLPRKHELETALRDGMITQWPSVAKTEIEYAGNTITRRAGYAPLFIYEPTTDAMVFHFYAGGKLAEKVTLRRVETFAR